jgi:hypothetical protein
METASGCNLCNDIHNRTSIAQDIRARIEQIGLDWIYLNSFCITNEIVSSMKKQPEEWEKIFVSFSSDRRLLSRINKELKKIKHQKSKFFVQ